MKPLISVVVPAYNEEKLLPGCLTSLQKQSFTKPFEIVVVDNNSTDRTPTIARQFGVRVVTERNKGVIFAKQQGYLSSRGNFVVFVDADCIVPPTWLQNIISPFHDPTVVAVTGPYTIIDGPKFHQYYARFAQFITWICYRYWGKNLYLSGGNCAYRKTVLDKFHCFDVTKGVGEDEYGILSKVLKYGRVIYCPKTRILTSGRRASRGFFDFLSQMLVRYSLNFISLRTFGKAIFPPYSDFR